MTNANDPIGFDSHQLLIPSDMPKEWAAQIAELTTRANGLTKREYFAAMAMQGFLAGGRYMGNLQNELCASEAVCVADALIAELNK